MTYGSCEDLETLREVEAFGAEKGLPGALARNNDNGVLKLKMLDV